MFFKAVYILILFFTIVIDYYAGILIEEALDLRKRKRFLWMSLAANIGVLAVFKYYNFLNGNISGLFNLLGYTNPIPFLSILLPIGLSFHTFQAMSYTIEVYRGNQKAERHFGIYSLYVMFYPQLVAGPIERPQNLLPQFHEQKVFKYDDVADGLKQMLWGFFKKLVIADRLAILVNTVYGDVHSYTGVPLIIAAVFFTYQIYCDFSGYSDIAIGAARVMGFKLMTNFNRPLASRSPSEIWKRWHISLSSWINDYLFTPMSVAFRNWEKWGIMLAIFISFSISGLWHGASWNFIIWGMLNGLALCYELLINKRRKKWAKKLNPVFYNFSSKILTVSFFTFTLIFFRANNFGDALYVIKHLFTNLKLQFGGYNMGLEAKEFFLAIIVIVLLEIFQFIQGKGASLATLKKFPRPVRWSLYYLLIISIVVYSGTNPSQFIYFQF